MTNEQQQKDYEEARDARNPHETHSYSRSQWKHGSDFGRSYTIKQMEGEWISVEDKLPEVRFNEKGQQIWSEWVLAAMPGGIFVSLACWDGEDWFTADNSHPEKRITHWRELPAKPITDKTIQP